MEVRAAETRVEVASAAVIEEPVPVVEASPSFRRRRPSQMPLRIAALSRSQEYAFIQADFRRLLVTAGSLLVLMVVILVVVE
jgi:hypothetical protein